MPHAIRSAVRGLRRPDLLITLLGTLAAALLLSACQPGVAPSAADNTTDATPVATQTAAEVAVVEAAPLAPDQTTGPVRLQIPAIGLDVPVIAMGWRLDVVNGVRTTVWDIPDDKAGWHINSAGAGAAGNTVISGRQVGGAAVFAPLALGSLTTGQQVLLTDGDGIVFVYRVNRVTQPIPITGATPGEEAQAAAYFAPMTRAQLTLVTGWPDFTTTHRVFVIADYVGVLR